MTKDEITELVYTYIVSNKKLAECIVNFLWDISSSDNITLENQKIVRFCMGMHEFIDEIDKKMSKLEKTVALYINRANEVFYWKQ